VVCSSQREVDSDRDKRRSKHKKKISRRQHTLVNNTRVQLDSHRSADDLAEETRRVAGVVCCWSGGVGAVGSRWCGHFFLSRVRSLGLGGLSSFLWFDIGRAV
jgi:hypothetical protein